MSLFDQLMQYVQPVADFFENLINSVVFDGFQFILNAVLALTQFEWLQAILRFLVPTL
ncbi:MAG: hypothetical protein FWH26_05365 [Oscillospiraceae bacterium]|nr:hypothetical protein [Oscillospiraceae bacterium]